MFVALWWCASLGMDSRLRGNDEGLAKEISTAPGTGNHKGCPYDGLAEAYFHGNDEERWGSDRWKW